MFKVKYLLKTVKKTATFYNQYELNRFIFLIKNNKDVSGLVIEALDHCKKVG